MPLRQILESTSETVQDFILAAEHRYWEAIELMTAGHTDAGVYLMGYTAEMLLKTACFLFDGALPAAPVLPLLSAAKQFQQIHLKAVKLESYHSLEFWALALEKKRSLANRPLTPAVQATFMSCVRNSYQTWWVEMRYRPVRALPRDAVQMYEDVSWLLNNHLTLWS